MSFNGWPDAALAFYRGLEADNSKAYWTAHREVYENDVLAPMEALLGDLAEVFGSGKVFRPYRDVRFSADKSPYKTAIGATLERGGYIQFSADGLAAGAGYHVMAADQLQRYRAAVAEERSGEALRAVIAELEAQGIEVGSRESLKTAPRGYSNDHPRVDLLRLKGMTAWKAWGAPAWVHSAEAKHQVVAFLRAARPLGAWLDAQVGLSRLDVRR